VFTLYTFDHISFSSSRKEIYFRKSCTEGKNTCFLFNNFFEIRVFLNSRFFFENRVFPEILVFFPKFAQFMRTIQATDTQINTEYVILLAFPQQQRLYEPTPMPHLHVLCPFHPFGTACFHIIVLSTLPPLHSTLVELSL
jgi:hypothetical protein